MQAVYNSFLSDITEPSEFIQPRRRTLIDRLVGRLAVGQIRGEHFLYEVHGPYAIPAQAEQPARPRGARLIAALKTFATAWSRRRDSRRAAQDWARLDDRTLKDIGLTRLEIEVAAWGHLRRKPGN